MNQAITQFEGRSSRHRYPELGRRIAGLMAGAWRDSGVKAPALSEAELKEIVPQLCESGAGALAWWRLRHTPLATTPSGQQLHDVYRRHRLSAVIHEREIAYVLSLLRAEGIEPVLIKGWAIARLYPDKGLRPYGDIDLCVRPDQFEKANAALKCLESMEGHYVDLHSSFEEVGMSRRHEAGKQKRARRIWDELFGRSQLVPLDPSKVQCPQSTVSEREFGPGTSDSGQTVRVLRDEDHLRVVSLHLLRSGVRRPPWLCDVAMLLEARTKNFDWNLCVGEGSDRDWNWLATTIGLAQNLLAAETCEIENPRLADQVRSLPRWLVPSVLRQWGRTRLPSSAGSRRPWTLDFGLWNKLDNPVRATAAVGGQFNNLPRLPYRLAELLMRVPEAPRQLLSLVNHLKVNPLSSEVSSEDRAGQARWNAKLRLMEE